jgi:formate/nitrite transporter FocA (FNT family)
MDAVAPCVDIALHKASATFGEVFARGIGGGILICCAICQAYAAREGVSKILGIWFCISTYVMCGWEHGLANMFFFPCAIFGNPGGVMTWGTFIGTNLIPSTLGNIVGGCILGAILTIIHNPSSNSLLK